MANPVAYPAQAVDNGTVFASCQITAGAAGAVGSVQRSRELKTTPVTHDGTGLYSFVFKEGWAHLEFAAGAIIQATWAAAGATTVTIIANNIKTTGIVQVQIGKGSDNTAVDLASGDILKMFFALQKIDPTV